MLSISSASSSSTTTTSIVAKRSQRFFLTAASLSSSSLVKRCEPKCVLLRHHRRRQRQRYIANSSLLSSPKCTILSSSSSYSTFVSDECSKGQIPVMTLSSPPMSVLPLPWGRSAPLLSSLSSQIPSHSSSSCVRFYSTSKISRQKRGDETGKELNQTVRMISPKNQLNNEYQKLKSDINNNNTVLPTYSKTIIFDTKLIKNDDLGGSMHTSSVYWPSTGEWFHSGTLVPSENAHIKVDEEDANRMVLYQGQGAEHFCVVDGHVYYRRKSTAEHAAAARAIDCLRYRARREAELQQQQLTTMTKNEKENKEKLDRLCFEEPYDLTTTPSSSSTAIMDYDLLRSAGITANIHTEEEKVVDTENDDDDDDDDILDDMIESEGESFLELLASQDKAEDDQDQSAMEKETFVTVENDEDNLAFSGNQMTTPLIPGSSETGEVIENKFIVKEEEKEDEEEEYMIVHLPVTGPLGSNKPALDKYDDGCDDLIFHDYSDKQQQQQQQQVGNTTMERILEAWADSSPLLNHQAKKTPSAALSSYITKGKKEETNAIANALAWYEIMMEHKHISATSFNAILNALADADDDIVERYLDHNHRKMMGKGDDDNIVSSPKTAASSDSGDEWRDLHGTEEGREDTTRLPKHVEELASQILSRMLVKNNSDEQHQQMPNADTFNAYIRCLRRSTSIETAKAAESVLKDMIQGRGGQQIAFLSQHDLPFPNVGTFNVVMELWSRAVSMDNELGKRKVCELYDLLEAQRIAFETLGGNKDCENNADYVRMPQMVRPNRETFLIALSSLARSTSESTYAAELSDGLKEDEDTKTKDVFSADEARKWIERMKRHADEYNDETLRADIEVYNAPLKWSGGERRGKRKFGNGNIVEGVSSPCKWDNYGHMFQNGFRFVLPENVASDKMMTEAQHMEDWLLDMEQMAAASAEKKGLEEDKVIVAPDIETYESIIQAWIRTGTMEGLLKAEGWANRTIHTISTSDNDVRGEVDDSFTPPPPPMPRLQTFHPIIAAWANCGQEQGPARVEEWISRLEELGNTFPEVQPDGRVHSSLILAWRKYQSQIMIGGGMLPSNDSSDKEEVTSVHNESSKKDDDLSTAELSFSIAKKCADCLEGFCLKLRKQPSNAVEDDDDDDDNDDKYQIFFDGSAFENSINAWKDAAIAFAVAENKTLFSGSNIMHQQEGERNNTKTHHALSEMLNTVRLFDDIIELYYNLMIIERTRANSDHGGSINEEAFYSLQRQLNHLLGTSYQVHRAAVSGIRQVDSCFHHRREGVVATISQAPHQLKDRNSNSYFALFFPHVEMMLRRSMEFQQMMLFEQEENADFLADDRADKGDRLMESALQQSAHAQPYCNGALDYVDLFSYESSNTVSSKVKSNDSLEMEGWHSSRYQLYSHILKGSACLISPRDYGNAIRVAICILEVIARERSSRSTVGSSSRYWSRKYSSSAEEDNDLTKLYIDIVSLVGNVVQNRHERMALLSHICKCTKNYLLGGSAPGSASRNITAADRESFVQAIRDAMNDKEMAEILLRDLQTYKKTSKKKRRAANKRRYRRAY